MKVLSRRKFSRCVLSTEIPGNEELRHNWYDILGQDWNGKPTSVLYERYLQWHRNNFSKLGKYLNEKAD